MSHATEIEPPQQDWRAFCKNVYSQNGEDGIVEEIFRRIGTTNRWCFEVGAADGLFFSNTRKLIDEGWNACLIEADPEKFKKLGQLGHPPRDGGNHVIAVHEAITPEGAHSLDAILQRQAAFPAQPDFGVIDVDGEDYYVFLNLLHHLPRVLLVEFDVTADADFIPERGSGKQAGRNAMARVANAKGYTVLGAMGPNLILAIDALVPKIRGDVQAPAPTGVRLNLASGNVLLPGYVNVDRKFGAQNPFGEPQDVPEGSSARTGEVYPLADADESAIEIRASHVLEHFPAQRAPDVLKDWVRVLKPGGVLKVAVPDFDKIIEVINAGNPNGLPIQGYIYGGQVDDDDFHHAGYNEEWLRHQLEKAGLVDVVPWASEVDDCAALPISLNLQGTKPKSPPPIAKPFPRHRKIVAVMSMPRLCFSETMFAALQVSMAYQIPFEKHTGAFWEACLTRVMEPHLTDGTEWICTLDYDTLFDAADFHRLAVLMEENPHADAIAPIQVKRSEDTGLFRPLDERTGEYWTGTMPLDEFDRSELIPVGWANFGLTFIRVSALKKMTKPWFVGVPDKDGGWGDGRTDPDIYFWENFRRAGCKLYIASHVTVGHQQVMGTFATQELGVTHQYVTDYLKNGKAAVVRK